MDPDPVYRADDCPEKVRPPSTKIVPLIVSTLFTWSQARRPIWVVPLGFQTAQSKLGRVFPWRRSCMAYWQAGWGGVSSHSYDGYRQGLESSRN